MFNSDNLRLKSIMLVIYDARRAREFGKYFHEIWKNYSKLTINLFHCYQACLSLLWTEMICYLRHDNESNSYLTLSQTTNY